MTVDLAGRTILVTGGSGGLGHGVLTELLASGAQVVATLHRAGSPVPAGVDVEVADLLDSAAVGPMVERVLARHPAIDGLICLVGGFRSSAFIQTDDATWRELIDLNLHTAVATIRATLPAMQSRGYGRIVTVGARQALEPTPNTSAYAAAKAALIAMTRSLARELRGSGVVVNCILPSTIDTPANRDLMPKANPDRWVKPEQIGRVIAFLCSEDAGIISGAAIPVYGDA